MPQVHVRVGTLIVRHDHAAALVLYMVIGRCSTVKRVKAATESWRTAGQLEHEAGCSLFFIEHQRKSIKTARRGLRLRPWGCIVLWMSFDVLMRTKETMFDIDF